MADASSWLDAMRVAERRGELLAAVDIADRGLVEHPDDLSLRHRSVLALARAGATAEAAKRFERYGLAASTDEDIAALEARLAKDEALAKSGAERTRAAGRARDLYDAVFSRTGGYYPAINAGSLSLVAGEPERSRVLARAALERVGASGEDSYFTAATEAEAHLLLGDEAAAAAALERAAQRHEGDYVGLASTRRQLRLLCELTGTTTDVLAPLAGPAVVHFCGHRIAENGRFPSSSEPAIADRIDDEVVRHQPGYAYGSLANGADILWAEALLRHGAELHVVLPFAREEFVGELRCSRRRELGGPVPALPGRRDRGRLRDRRCLSRR